MQLTGLLSFPLTPFTARDTVDLDVLAEHVEAQVAAGPAGLFVACGTGEFTALSIVEYRQVLRTALAPVAGRLPGYSRVGGGPRVRRGFLDPAAGAGGGGWWLLAAQPGAQPPAGGVDV